LNDKPRRERDPAVSVATAAAIFRNPLFQRFSAHVVHRENAEFRTLKHERGMATWNSQVGVPFKRFLK
jgi:arginine/lysine/ornithine decarboxylase